MKTKLTTSLLSFLIRKGYKYCLSQTTCLDLPDANICILLKPVKKHPLLQKLPKPFSAYYEIIQEPFRLATEVNNAQVMVELSLMDAKNFQLA